MKKLLTLAFVLLLFLTACGADKKEASIGLPNPYEMYNTLSDAQSAAGFDLTAPENIGSRTITGISVYKTDAKMLQLVYGEDPNTVTIRKDAFGAGGIQDISGMYVTYENTETTQRSGLTVTLKGSGSLICIATWSDSDFNYAIISETGLIREEILQLAEAVQ